MAIDCRNLKVYCRGVDLSTHLQSTAVDQSREEVDVTVHASSIRAMQGTFPSATLAHAGLYEDGANTIGEVFRQGHSAGGVEPFTILPGGATVGQPAILFLAHSAGLRLPEDMAPGEVVKCSMRASARAAIPLNGVVSYSGAISADTATTPLNLGAPAVLQQSVVAVVHLLTLVPAASATFFLESDTLVGFGSPTVRATSTAQTARGSVLLQAAGPLTGETHWRVRWDWTGPGSFTALISLGLVA